MTNLNDYQIFIPDEFECIYCDRTDTAYVAGVGNLCPHHAEIEALMEVEK